MTFKTLGLSQPILSVLQEKRIVEPTPIQEQSIPHVLRGEDVLGIAKTGTGKTFAFVLPLLQQLMNTHATVAASALIIVPTRELAFQIQETIRIFERTTRMFSAVIIGGASEGQQLRELRKNPQILIATPGRLQDLMDKKKINLRNTAYVVLDEADRMLDMGFAPQIKKIFQAIPAPGERQLLLFSATMPDSIIKIVQTMMNNPVHIEIASPGSTVEATKQEVVVLDSRHRKDALVELLNTAKGTVLVFTRTKYQAKELNAWLRTKAYRSEEIHGNRSLPQRTKAVDAILKKRSRILVATDIAARGIDIPNIELVVNYFLPDNPEDYVHRIGRTGRAGKIGWAVSFVSTDQYAELQSIQRLINMTINQAQLTSVPTALLIPTSTRRTFGGRGGRRGGGSRGGFSRGGGSRPGGSRSGGSRPGGSRSGGSQYRRSA